MKPHCYKFKVPMPVAAGFSPWGVGGSTGAVRPPQADAYRFRGRLSLRPLRFCGESLLVAAMPRCYIIQEFLD